MVIPIQGVLVDSRRVSGDWKERREYLAYPAGRCRFYPIRVIDLVRCRVCGGIGRSCRGRSVYRRRKWVANAKTRILIVRSWGRVNDSGSIDLMAICLSISRVLQVFVPRSVG